MSKKRRKYLDDREVLDTKKDGVETEVLVKLAGKSNRRPTWKRMLLSEYKQRVVFRSVTR